MAWRTFDGEAVLVSPDDSRLHTLNAVGTLIWEAADGRTAMDEIVGRVCEAFDVEPTVAALDVRGFVTTLSERGLLTTSERSEA
ncbi:MAG: PqqD family protein [Candidatus Rokubacteria bacterium]|nr:PqqD family protein [Candidatus Rokubacteria bacterium]